MKKLPVILLLFFACTTFAQQRQVSFGEIDDRVKDIDPAPPAQLAYLLTKDYSTDKEKLRSIFSWITEHISYRVKKKFRTFAVNHTSTIYADTGRWKSLGDANDMVAQTVLQNKSAVCDGYARLFTSLCNYAGLRSAVICGFAKGDFNRQVAFRCNHTWNAVYVDSSWHLLDVTWASGYTNYSGDEFIKRYDETYFLPSPEDFARDHFPDDVRWTLLEKPSCPRELNSAPYKSRSFTKYRITGYLPAPGIIEAAPGDTLQFELNTNDPQSDTKMAADTVQTFDSVQQKIISSIAFPERQDTSTNKKTIHYTFCVKNDNTEWLHIVYNHDTILRYKLKINKEKLKLRTANKEQVIVSPFLYLSSSWPE